MLVTVIRGDGTVREFTHVKTIEHHLPRLVVLHFREGHPYLANEVYLRMTEECNKLEVTID